MLKKLGYAAVLLIALVAPFVMYPVLLMKILCFALFACAFNLLIGFTGLLSFGHAAFFGGASYIAGHALKVWGVPTELGILLGVIFAAIVGLVMGKLAIRRQGIYFTMITMALSQMLFFVFLQAPFTGGEDGLQSIPRGTLLGFIDLKNDLTLYYVVFGIVVLSFLLVVRIIHSPFGQVLKAVRACCGWNSLHLIGVTTPVQLNHVVLVFVSENRHALSVFAGHFQSHRSMGCHQAQ